MLMTMKNILLIQKKLLILQKFVAKFFNVENWNNNIKEAILAYKSYIQLIYNLNLNVKATYIFLIYQILKSHI